MSGLLIQITASGSIKAVLSAMSGLLVQIIASGSVKSCHYLPCRLHGGIIPAMSPQGAFLLIEEPYVTADVYRDLPINTNIDIHMVRLLFLSYNSKFTIL